METIEECLRRMAECFKTLRSDRKQFFPASVQIQWPQMFAFEKKEQPRKQECLTFASKTTCALIDDGTVEKSLIVSVLHIFKGHS